MILQMCQLQCIHYQCTSSKQHILKHANDVLVFRVNPDLKRHTFYNVYLLILSRFRIISIFSLTSFRAIKERIGGNDLHSIWLYHIYISFWTQRPVIMSIVLPILFVRSQDVEDSTTHIDILCGLPSVAMSSDRESHAQIQSVQLVFKMKNVDWWITEELWKMVHDFSMLKIWWKTTTKIWWIPIQSENPQSTEPIDFKQKFRITNDSENFPLWRNQVKVWETENLQDLFTMKWISPSEKRRRKAVSIMLKNTRTGFSTTMHRSW